MTLGVETRRGMGALLKINSGAQQLTIRYQAFFLARPRLTRFSRSGDAGRQGGSEAISFRFRFPPFPSQDNSLVTQSVERDVGAKANNDCQEPWK